MKKFLSILILTFLLGSGLHAQNAITPYFSYGKGLGITSPDSIFMLNIRFRIQNRFAFTTESLDDLDIAEVEARVRRLRLRFDGFIYNPKLTYVIQLSFSRADLDFDDTGFPNVVRDAIVFYNFNKHFTIGLGQTKLPGNRQRVNSSGDLQLPDRSIVNSTFNVDRDFGLQLYYNNQFGFMTYVLRGAITSGEGRNVSKSDRGLAYTGRLELLPFGHFTNGGDYFEGDLSREPKPKVSIGLTYSDNENATRTGGQLGVFLPPGEQRDIETSMLDFLFKYKGWALASEYLDRSTINPVILTDPVALTYNYIYKGYGFNVQGSYLFRNNWELVSRFSEVKPDAELIDFTPYTKQYTIGTTKYVKGHRVKLQCDVTLEDKNWLSDVQTDSKNWQVRFQVEAGI
jgi:phosphate-selective porin OprO and OprP